MHRAVDVSRLDRGLLQAACAQAALGFCVTSIGASVALLARDLDVPAASLAWLSSAFGAGLLLVAAAGPRVLRRGPAPPLRAGALILALGVVVFALAPTAGAGAAGAALLGLGGAALVLVTPALLSGADAAVRLTRVNAAVRLTRVNAAASTAGVLAPITLGALDTLGPSGRLALLLAVPPLLLLVASARPGSGSPGSAAPGPPHAASTSGVAVPSDHTDGRAAPAVRRETTRRWARVVLAVSVEFCFLVWAVARLQETGLADGTAAVLGSAFPVGMAAGRLAAPRMIARTPIVPGSAVVAATGSMLVAATGSPATTAVGLMVAGLGLAVLYPVTLADLVATPGLAPAHAAALGALASGTAILVAPAALAGLGSAVGLSVAFLITLPLLAALTLLRPARSS